MASMRGIDSIIKQGGVVAFSPEGMSSISGHNQPVVSGTGKYLKHYRIPVYCLKTAGAFLTNTKSCLDERRGRIEVKLFKLFSKEDLERLSPNEIEEKVNETLTHDDYLWNEEKKIHYETHGHIAKDLHYLCYKCPSCGEEFAMNDSEDRLYCKRCGAGVQIDDTYALTPSKKGMKLPKNISNWFDWERQCVAKEIKNDTNFVFEEHVKLGKLDPYKPLKNKKRVFFVAKESSESIIRVSPIKAKKTAKNSHFICLMRKSILLECQQTRVMYLFIMQGNITISFPKGQQALRCCSLLRKCIVSM